MRIFLLAALWLFIVAPALADEDKTSSQDTAEARVDTPQIASTEESSEELAKSKSFPAFQPGIDSGGAGADMIRHIPQGRMCKPSYGCVFFAHCNSFWCACEEEAGSVCYQNYCFTNCQG